MVNILGSEQDLSRFIPYMRHATDEVVVTNAGEFLSVWKISGREHECFDITTKTSWIRSLNQMLISMSQHHVALWTHLHRRKVKEYHVEKNDNYFCNYINERYAKGFENYPMMVNDLYLTVMLKHSDDKLLKFLSKGEKKNIDEKLQLHVDNLKKMDEINNIISQSMQTYTIRCLKTYESDEHVYSETLEWLGYLVNQNKYPIPVCREHINQYLNQDRILFHRYGEMGEVRHLTDTTYFGMLDVKSYENGTNPGELDELLHSEYEFILTQSFCPLSLFAARGFLKNHKTKLINAHDVAISQIDEISEALDQLESGKFLMGEHHASLLVQGKSLEEVQKAMAESKAAFAKCGIVSVSSDLAIESAYYAQLPGNFQYRPRPMPITSLNFFCFSSFHNYYAGKPSGNPWGEAVTIFKTPSNTSFYFNYHQSSDHVNDISKRLLGHTLILGQSSAGKTVLLNFLLSQSIKYNPTIVCFDKDRGMEIAILAMGGQYFSFKQGIPTGLNPLQFENNAENKSFLKEWLLKLTALAGDIPHTHEEEVEITNALETLLTNIEKPSRTITTLLQLLPDPEISQNNRPSVSARLHKWQAGQELGYIFDNPTHTLDLTKNLFIGFDITEFIDNPVTRTPISMVLMHQTDQLIDGRRFILSMDEFWKILADPYFQETIKDKLKTIRKLNGICIFSTQEPEDGLQSPIASTIRQQIATVIALENSKASKEIYCKKLGLTESEFETFQKIRPNSRTFLVKQGDKSVLATFDIGKDPDILSVLSGSPDQADLALECIAEYGSNPIMWLPIFYERRGVAR